MASIPVHIFSIEKSNDPIFVQLVDQVRRYVAAGRIAPGDKMPSVREVSQALNINPMTVSKAYQVLSVEGVLERRRGALMTVAAGLPAASGALERTQLIRPEMESVVLKARQLGMDGDSIRALLDDIVRDMAHPLRPRKKKDPTSTKLEGSV